MAKSRITCREGDGWSWDTARGHWVVLAQRTLVTKRGRRVRVGEEEERPRRKAGEGSRDGWIWEQGFKREGIASGHPRALRVLVGG